MVPNPTTLPSFSYLSLIASWEIHYNQLTEEEKTQAWFIDGPA